MNIEYKNQNSVYWPLAIRLEVLPGSSVLDRFSNAAKYGFDAVELPGRYLADYKDELLKYRNKLPLRVSSISLGFRGSLLSQNEPVRKQCREDIKELLDLCAELGAVGLVMPPVLHMDNQERLPNPAEGRSRIEAEDKLLLQQLPELVEYAHRRRVSLMIEPVNHKETDYLYTLEHAVNLCEQINHPGLGITADYFHMNLSEAAPLEALRNAAKWVRLFHISEKPERTEPLSGGLDFQASFKVLKEIDYKGFIVLECRSLTKDADKALPVSLQYIRGLIDQV